MKKNDYNASTSRNKSSAKESVKVKPFPRV